MPGTPSSCCRRGSRRRHPRHPTARPPPANDSLRCCSCLQWNIERGYELAWIIEELRRIDADILSLQARAPGDGMAACQHARRWTTEEGGVLLTPRSRPSSSSRGPDGPLLPAAPGLAGPAGGGCGLRPQRRRRHGCAAAASLLLLLPPRAAPLPPSCCALTLPSVFLLCETAGAAIAQALGLNYAFLSEFEELRSPLRDERSQGGGVHGNAILTKFDFSEAAVVPHR